MTHLHSHRARARTHTHTLHPTHPSPTLLLVGVTWVHPRLNHVSTCSSPTPPFLPCSPNPHAPSHTPCPPLPCAGHRCLVGLCPRTERGLAVPTLHRRRELLPNGLAEESPTWLVAPAPPYMYPCACVPRHGPQPPAWNRNRAPDGQGPLATHGRRFLMYSSKDGEPPVRPPLEPPPGGRAPPLPPCWPPPYEPPPC